MDKASQEAPETDLQPKNFYLMALWRHVDMSLVEISSSVPNQRMGQSHIRVVYAHTAGAHPSVSLISSPAFLIETKFKHTHPPSLPPSSALGK